MKLEQAIIIAKNRILLPGLKPEDYLMVSDDFPLTIAKAIVKEAKLIQTLSIKENELLLARNALKRERARFFVFEKLGKSLRSFWFFISQKNK